MREVNTFCETPEEGCTMSYCDDNGCLNRECSYVEETTEPTEKSFTEENRLNRNMKDYKDKLLKSLDNGKVIKNDEGLHFTAYRKVGDKYFGYNVCIEKVEVTEQEVVKHITQDMQDCNREFYEDKNIIIL